MQNVTYQRHYLIIMLKTLSEKDLQRYSSQIILKNIGYKAPRAGLHVNQILNYSELLDKRQLKKYNKPIQVIPAMICNHLNNGCTSSIKPPL